MPYKIFRKNIDARFVFFLDKVQLLNVFIDYIGRCRISTSASLHSTDFSSDGLSDAPRIKATAFRNGYQTIVIYQSILHLINIIAIFNSQDTN
jgi:hypothetical protein